MSARVTQLAAKPRPVIGNAGARGHVGALSIALALLGCGSEERPGDPPRHLIMVTVDTLRADRLSAWGHARVTSDLAGLFETHGGLPPGRRSLDQLAAEGVLFAHAFAPRGMTFPSMATLFSGRSPKEHGAISNGNTLCDNIPTLAESLSEAGFETGAFTANPLLAERSGIEQGFGFFFTDTSAERDLKVVRAATAWLVDRDLRQGPPVFLWLHLMGPHMPYEPGVLDGVDYQSLFTNPEYSGGADGSRKYLDTAYREEAQLTAADIDHVRSLYDGEVARIDHLVSLFVEVLSGTLSEQTFNLLDESLFIFASDHGEELHQRHGYWAHSKSIYDSVLHVPLFIRHPASLTGRRVIGELVELQDLMPTILDWLDVPLPNGIRGRSLLPLLDGDEFDSRPAMGVWKDSIFTLRTDRWRLVWNPDGLEPDDPPRGPYPIPELALFDIRSDPLEQRDVSELNADLAADFKARIRAWRDQLKPVCIPDSVISPERFEQLEDLGYVESKSSPPDEEAD